MKSERRGNDGGKSTGAFLAVIILNWNQRDLTLDCLRSVLSQSFPMDRLQLIVVDNGSSDGTPEAVRDLFPTVIVLETGGNLGYAGGNNVGIRFALNLGAEWVLILNNDVTLADDCLNELEQAAKELPQAGALGPLVMQADSLDEIQTAGGYFTNGLEYEWRGTGNANLEQFDKDTPHSVDLLPGCALLISRRVFNEVGLFDNRFFMYREDIDLCLRISSAGYGLYLVPSARAWHRRPSTGKKTPPHIVYYMARNSLLLAHKHRMPIEVLKFLRQDFTAWLLWKMSPRWRGMDPQAAARLDGVKDYFLQRFGRSPRWSPNQGL